MNYSMARSNTMMEAVKEFVKEYVNKRVLGIALLVSIVIYTAVIIPTKVAYADQKVKMELTYDTIQIQSGDTLWSIANTHYTKECKSIKQYIELIKSCNSLYNDDITAGCYLILPHYTETTN